VPIGKELRRSPDTRRISCQPPGAAEPSLARGGTPDARTRSARSGGPHTLPAASASERTRPLVRHDGGQVGSRRCLSRTYLAQFSDMSAVICRTALAAAHPESAARRHTARNQITLRDERWPKPAAQVSADMDGITNAMSVLNDAQMRSSVRDRRSAPSSGPADDPRLTAASVWPNCIIFVLSRAVGHSGSLWPMTSYSISMSLTRAVRMTLLKAGLIVRCPAGGHRSSRLVTHRGAWRR
jgi:hypothetical protein